MAAGWHILGFSLLLLFLTTQARVFKSMHELKRKGLNRLPDGPFRAIQVLNIFNSNLSELDANAFYNREFFNLKKIILRNDSITNIQPHTFAKMSKVAQLDLYGNKMTMLEKSSFEGLGSLQDLNLGKNRIFLMDETILEALPLLETLDLSHNSITDLRRTFIKRSSIADLSLKGNSLVFNQHGSILESDTLTHLNLQSCALKKLPADAFTLVPNLESLDISKNQLQVLPDGLLSNQIGLEHLDLSFNRIVHIRREVFYAPSNLDELYWDGNPLQSTMDCAEFLEEILRGYSEETKEQEPSEEKSSVEEVPVHDGSWPHYIHTTVSRSFSKPHVVEEVSADTNSSEFVVTEYEAKPPGTVKRTSSGVIYSILIYAIVVVGIVCLVLAFILLGQIYYITRPEFAMGNSKL